MAGEDRAPCGEGGGAVKRLRMPDRYDLVILAGLGFLGYGAWKIDLLPASYLVIGLFLVLVGVVGSMYKARNG